jgi:hypothetical protein
MKKKLLLAFIGAGLFSVSNNALGMANIQKGIEALGKLNNIVLKVPAIALSIDEAQRAQKPLSTAALKEATLDQRLEIITRFLGVAEKWKAVLSLVSDIIPKDDVKGKAQAAINELGGTINLMQENIGAIRMLVTIMQSAAVQEEAASTEAMEVG